MRILSVGNLYPPHSFGGYELIWRAAVEHLRRRGHDVRVLTTDTRTDATEPDDPGVYRELRWHLRDGGFDEVGALGAVALARHNHAALRRQLDGWRPDVVTWWSMGGLTLSMLESVRRRSLPAVAFVSDEWLDYGRHVDPWLSRLSGPRRRVVAPVAERVAGVPAAVRFGPAAEYVFVSEYTRRQALRLDLGLERTSVAHTGIADAFLDPAPPRDWGWRLLYVGRLDPRKGVATAIEALRHLPSEARLDIAGGWDRREEARLRDVATGLGSRVRFLGQQRRDALVGLYGEADVVVFPVVWQEPWGLVPLEAMGRGRPVVATGRGGSAEYLRDGENALLFEAQDAEALARAVRRLADDPALRGRLREGGLRTAPLHTEARFNEAVEDAVTRVGAS